MPVDSPISQRSGRRKPGLGGLGIVEADDVPSRASRVVQQQDVHPRKERSQGAFDHRVGPNHGGHEAQQFFPPRLRRLRRGRIANHRADHEKDGALALVVRPQGRFGYGRPARLDRLIHRPPTRRQRRQIAADHSRAASGRFGKVDWEEIGGLRLPGRDRTAGVIQLLDRVVRLPFGPGGPFVNRPSGDAHPRQPQERHQILARGEAQPGQRPKLLPRARLGVSHELRHRVNAGDVGSKSLFDGADSLLGVRR
jgi:hypothetical protein